jgi:hypothetical protein
MKPILISVAIIVFCTFNLLAQYFAPVGAKWYYTKINFDNVGYFYAESIKDTVVNGKNCRKIINDNVPGNYDVPVNYVYDSDSIVYFYCKKKDSFQILSNFKAKKGDSWTTYFTCMGGILDSVQATVDTVYRVNIIGHSLIRQEINYKFSENGITYNAIVTEKIGDNQFLFNLNARYQVTDAEMSNGLRCYSDPDFGTYSTGIAPTCTYTGIELPKNNEIKIYPNPVKNQIMIDSRGSYNVTLAIYNITGALKMKQKLTKNKEEISISNLPKGTYLIKISGNNRNYIQKFIKD